MIIDIILTLSFWILMGIILIVLIIQRRKEKKDENFEDRDN